MLTVRVRAGGKTSMDAKTSLKARLPSRHVTAWPQQRGEMDTYDAVKAVGGFDRRAD